MFTHPRESWQSPAQPVRGPAFAGWGRYTDVAMHYTSAARIPADLDAYHRAMQADYERNRGYSLGYTCSVAQSGPSREIRGLDFTPAATKGANGYALAILMLVDGNDMASPAACAEVRRIIGAWEQLSGRQLHIRPHDFYVPTGCPGTGVRAQITLGEFSPRWNPTPAPPPPIPTPNPEEDDMPVHVHYIGTPDPTASRPELLLIQGKLVGFASPADRDAAVFSTGASTWPIANPAQYDEVVRSFRA